MKRSVIVITILFLLVLSIAFSENDNNDKVDKEVEELLNQQDEVSVIIMLEDDYKAINEDVISDVSEKDGLEKKKIMINELQSKVLSNLNYNSKDEIDFKLRRKFTLVNGLSGEITKQGLEKLRNDPNIKKIYPNRPVKAFLDESAEIVNATNTWKLVYNGTNLTGKGETVCIIDTGVDYTHPDLGGCFGQNCKVIGGYAFIASDSDPMDDHGHGTHVAGIVASSNEIYTGIAPDANIVAIKVLDSGGNGQEWDLIAGIDWCVNNASRFNITVISMSLGVENYKSTAYCDASDNPLLVDLIHNAISRNISVIAAAGNDGNSKLGVSSPACISKVTVVGSTTKNDLISSFSDLWSLPMLLAPGGTLSGIHSCPTNNAICSTQNTQNGGGFIGYSGTSMSTPHVAAAFALMHQYIKLIENSDAKPSEIQEYLKITGKQIYDSKTSLTFPRINILAAILSYKTPPIITFTGQTPENNTKTSKNSLTINITSDRLLSVALLEFNGTNETMKGSGLNWFKNKTVPSNQNATYTYKVWGSDSMGNSGVSEFRVFTSNNTPPVISAFEPLDLDLSLAEGNYNFTFNVTAFDPDNNPTTIFWYKNNSLAEINSNFTFAINFSAAGFYNVTVEVFDGNLTNGMSWKLAINNTNIAPNVTSVNLTSTDFLNRTNGTLQSFWSISDFDNDKIMTNETKWYNNTKEVLELRNSTFVSPQNTAKGQNWVFSVRGFDGTDWSDFVNALIIIKNTAPKINMTDSITVNETQKVNISVSAFDIDNDLLTFDIDDPKFMSTDGTNFIWQTTLADSGTFDVNIIVNDTEDTDSKIVKVIVLDVSDMDNDGIPDENDFLLGDAEDINTTLPLSLAINGTSNLSKPYEGTFLVEIINGNSTIVEFNFTFNSSSILDLRNIILNRTVNGSSAISLKGLNLSKLNETKTFFLEKINSTVAAVCIKDIDTSLINISSECNSDNEFLVNCNNQSSNGYTCLDIGTSYKVVGLSNSVVKELCIDKDGDKYGTGCSLGFDCNDNDASKNTDCSTNSISSSGNSGSGPSSSGGGGGGGSASAFTCNMDWSCTDWSACENGWETRECSFVKVTQHKSTEECPVINKPPQMARKCEVPKITLESVSEIKSEERNETEAEEEVKTTQETDTTQNQGFFSAITGAATRVLANPDAVKELKIISWVVVIVILGILGYKFGYKKYKKKEFK